MEKGGSPVALAETEPAAVPNLLDNPAYAEQMLSYGGLTKSLRQFASMCPVDLSDPRITTEAINTFAVKFINGAGGEVQPGDEGYFRAVLAQKEIEPKFKIAEPVPEAKDVATREATERNRQAPVAGKPVASAVRAQKTEQAAINRQTELLARRIDEHMGRAQLQVHAEDYSTAPLTPVSEPVRKTEKSSHLPVASAKARPQPAAAPATAASPKAAPVRVRKESYSPPEAVDFSKAEDLFEPVPDACFITRLEIAEPDIVETVEIIPEAGPALSQEPLPVFTSLRELLTQESVSSPAEGAETGQRLVMSINKELTTYTHEPFAETEPERELLVLGLDEEASQIAAFLVEMDLAQETEEARVEQTMQRLETVCERILQELELPYDEAVITKLRNTFLQEAAAAISKREEAQVALDKGTHESKLDVWFDDFVRQSSLAQLLQQFAGFVALRLPVAERLELSQ